MKIIKQPTIYLVGKQQVIEKELSEFLKDHSVPDWKTDTDIPGQALPEIAGRTCYMSFSNPRPGGNKTYLQHIIEVGHGSVLEHSVFNFIFCGISRSLSHELVRHRAGVGISQLSQRYVDESVAEYIEPDCIFETPEAHEIWLNTVNQAHEAYCKLVKLLYDKFSDVEDKTARRKQARQAARSVLPNATETKIFWTANVRAIRNVLEQRCTRHAEAEIRKLAMQLYEIMIKEAPNLFADYTKVPLEDGTFELTTEFRKV